MKPEDFRSDFLRTLRYCKRNGIRDTAYSAAERLYLKASDRYSYTSPSGFDQREQREWSLNLDPDERVRISVVVPAFNTDRNCLVQLINSVARQSYPYYELVIADAGDSGVVEKVCREALSRGVLAEAPEMDFRPRSLRYVKLSSNGGISANLNAGVSNAWGDWVQFLDHDDLLTPDALFLAAYQIRKKRDASFVFFDEDKTDRSGKTFFDLNDKHGLNPDLFFTNNYICHAVTFDKELVEIHPFRTDYDGAQDYDLILRIMTDMMIAGLSPEKMREFAPHEGVVAYHWRVHRGSSAGDASAKKWAYDAGLRALQDFYDRLGIKAKVTHSRHLGFYKTEYLPDVFTARKDVGAVCGRVLDPAGRMCAYMGSIDGEELFYGLPDRFSGRLNRFDCTQDVKYGDVRNMRLRPELRHLFSEVTDSNVRLRSEKICTIVRDAGFKVMYDPDLSPVRAG